MSLSRGAFRAVLLLVLSLWSLLLLGWLILHWGILPHIDEWRPDIERKASAALGTPVAIAAIEVRSPGWVPVLTLRDVVLSDRQGRQALRLPRIEAAVSPRSLLVFSLRFSQLYIEGAQLEVRRDRAGRLHVGGLDMDGAAVEEDRGGSDWFFEQPEVVVRHGQLRWIDELRNVPPLALADVDFVARNGLRSHDLRLDATPPEGWGRRFSLRGRFVQPLIAPAGDWRRWRGTLHADLPYADVAALHRYAALPFQLQEGRGALRWWLDVDRASWRSAALDLGLDSVRLQLDPKLPALVLRQLSGRLQAERDANGVRLDARDLAFATEDGVSWPAGRLALSWQQRQDLGLAPSPTVTATGPAPAASSLANPAAAPVTGGELSADRLDLGLIARLASRLPLPQTLLRTLDETAPEGLVQGLQVSWQGAPEAPERYRVKGRLTGSSIVAHHAETADAPSRPGWRSADLELDANESGGEGRLSVRDGALELPGVFEDPVVPLDRFQAKLVWQVQRREGQLPALQLLVQDGRFANADGQGELQARWQTGDDAPAPPPAAASVASAASAPADDGRYPGRLELSGRITRLDAARVARYLPLGIGNDARQYVSQAVLSGEIPQLSFKLRGPLQDFPFQRAQDGEFHVAAKVQNLHFAYVPAEVPGTAPAWPAFTGLTGDLVFDRGSMQIRNAQARVNGLELKPVNGQIADLIGHPALQIEGTVRGTLADGLRYVAASPVEGFLQGALHEAVGAGAMELKLGLHIPLDDVNRTSVKGQLQLPGNDLRLRPDLPLFGNARARIDFTQQGFSLSNGAARLLGGDASFDGGMGTDGAVRFQGQGVASADGLKRAPEMGWLSRLGEQLKGQTPYKLQMAIQQGQTEMLITSPLTGMASNLPAPLRKDADTPLPLRYQTALAPPATAAAAPAGAASAPLRDTLRVELGNVLQLEYQRDLSQPEPKVLRGAVAVGEPLPAATPGSVQAVARLGSVNLDAWQAVAEQLAGPPAPAKAAAPGSTGAPSALAAATTSTATSGYVPTDLSLKAQALTVSGRHLSHLAAQGQRRFAADGEHWRFTLQSDQAEGAVDYRAAGREASGLLHARFARLSVPQAEADTVDTLFDELGEQPPALDIVVDDFELRGKKLGKLEVEAAYRGADWRLAKLNLTLPEARLSGSGQWSPGARQRMALDFRLDLADSGALLERLGMGRVVRGGKGRLQGQVAWAGSPLSPDFAGLSGQMQLGLDSGQFLKVDPGAARLLGVLSLQALPRRFLLDFRDLFQQGFAFDNVSGDVALADGLARTNNLRIRGVQAVVLMEGQADLRKETQDLRVVVVPDLNAGTASLAYAAINPVIGLGTFLAQWFLRKPLMQASTREFRVTGPWAEPNVVPVERKRDAPLPDLDPEAAAPAASAAMP